MRMTSRSNTQGSQQRELAQLRAQIQELMYINNEWDKEYREQREAFRRYQDDAQQAQMENHTAIARLKEKLATVEEERDSLEDELARHQRELHSLRERLAMAESLGEGVGRGGAEEGEVARLKEELFFAKQQLEAYREDFESEKSEKERLREEKQSVAIKYEAEKTSLQLRLDRCQADLAHFTTEANRLAQQLRLKNQFEQETYREHLENKGFVPRSPGCLPPLDPYVEIDQDQMAARATGSSSRLANTERVLRNGVNGGRVQPSQQQMLGNDFSRLSIHDRVSPTRRHSPNQPLGPPKMAASSYRLVARGLPEKRDAYSAVAKLSSDGLSSSSSSSESSGSVDSDEAEGEVSLASTKGMTHTRPRRSGPSKDDQNTLQQHRDSCLASGY